jgi:hypothetical protein
MKLLGMLLVLGGISVLAVQFIKKVLEKEVREQMPAAWSAWGIDSEEIKSQHVCTRITLNYGADANDLLGLCNSLKAIGISKEFGVKSSQVFYELSTRMPLKVSNSGEVFETLVDADRYFDELVGNCRQTFYSPIEITSDNRQNTELPSHLQKSENVIIDVIVLYEGSIPEVETDLASSSGGLGKALFKLSEAAEKGWIKAEAVFTLPLPGDDLTEDQVLINFPELLPLG